jgi:teichuronic acid exporter
MSNQQHYLWAFLERVAPLVISFVASVIMARMVSPEAYGLVAMLGIFMVVGQTFAELGFSAALVQRKYSAPDDQTSVFVVNVVAGLLITATLCAASPLVAQFFHQEILIPLLCIQSIGVFIGSMGLVQFALLSREMNFRLGSMITSVATIVSSIVGISMAAAGYGVWSLVGLGLSSEVVKAVAAWILVGWRPRGQCSMARVEAMWSYSGKLFYSSLIHHIGSNLNSVIIGRIFAPAALGVYTRAKGLQLQPVGLVTGIAERVAFPLFAKHQDDRLFLLQSLRKQIRVLVLVVSLMMALLAVLAPELIPLLYGLQWERVVPLLEILCIAGVFGAALNLHSRMTMALGKSGLLLKIELLNELMTVVVLAVVYRYGLLGFAWGGVASALIYYLLSAFPSRKMLGYSWRMQFMDLVPAFLIGGLPALLLFNIPWSPSWSVLTVMSTKIIAFFSVTYFGLFVFRKTLFQDPWNSCCTLFAPAVARFR